MIPAARGLGSSAAAIIAGLLLGSAVGRRSPEADEILAAATRLEGHPDNVAAALYGGFTLAVGAAEAPITLRRFHVPEGWIPVVFIPAAESHTVGDARRAARARPAGRRVPAGRPRRRCWPPRS